MAKRNKVSPSDLERTKDGGFYKSDDAETLRRVREWADCVKGSRFPARKECAAEVLAILNGTERKETKR